MIQNASKESNSPEANVVRLHRIEATPRSLTLLVLSVIYPINIPITAVGASTANPDNHP
jgi:hypothetical protein